MNNLVTIKLSNPAPAFVQPSEENAARQFSGIAHSGKPFSQYGTRYIVDLSNLQYRAKVGVLMEHSPERKTGVGQLSVGAEGLRIDGTLLNTEHGQHVAMTADDGYPWELSAYIQSAKQEQLSDGETVVNGHTVAAPIVILRDCMVREVSFVALGADPYTNAVLLSDGTAYQPDFALSDQSNQPQPEQEKNTMTKEEQEAFDAMKAELEALKAEKAQLAKEKADAEKKANVDKKLSAAGFKATDNGFEGIAEQTYRVLLALDDDQADALVGNLKLAATPTKPTLPDALTQDHHQPNDSGSLKLSGLAADAERRRQQAQGYI